jgi:hypothetical protein
VWLNPVTTIGNGAGTAVSETTWVISSLAFNPRTLDPSMLTPGTPGNVLYYPGLDGINKETQYITFDFYLAQAILNQKKNEFNAFNTVSNTYNTSKNTYDTAVRAENTRKADLMKASFEPAIALPTRPCPPSPPAHFDLFNIQLSGFLASSPTPAYISRTTAGSNVTLVNTIGGTQTNPTVSQNLGTRSGFLRVTGDTTAPVVYTSSGHVQGLLGQGVATMPTNASPFQWLTAATGNAPGLYISIYPNADADTGLAAAADTITIGVMAKPWADLGAYTLGAPPSAPQAPMNASGVKLAAGFVAAATVFASLY